DWNAGFVKCLGVRLAGDLIGDTDEKGEPIVGDTLLVLLNAHHEALPFTLPPTKPEHHWERLLDTTEPANGPLTLQGGQQYPLQGRSLAVLRTGLNEEKVTEVSPLVVDTLLKEQRRVPQPSPGPTFGSVS